MTNALAWSMYILKAGRGRKAAHREGEERRTVGDFTFQQG